MQRPWVTSAAYAAAIEVIVRLRQEHGLSQRALAERLGKPRSFVSKIENKERRLDLVELIVIARAMGLSAEDVVKDVAAALPEVVDF